MPRRRVKIAFIENRKQRKNTFLKRKESLKKQLNELSILCGVEACAMILSPYEPGLEVWPEDNTVFQNVLNNFMSKSQMERSKFMFNQDAYVNDRIRKVTNQFKKQTNANREMSIAQLMSECFSCKVSVDDLNPTDSKDLVSLADYKLSKIEEKMKELKIDAPAAAQPPQSHLPQPQEGIGGSNTASIVAAEGADEDVYVPVTENPGAFDEEETPGWYPPDWTSNDEEHGLDLVQAGTKMMNPFPDETVPSWSDAHDQKKG